MSDAEASEAGNGAETDMTKSGEDTFEITSSAEADEIEINEETGETARD
jgi:hypothetical protein